MADMCDTCGDGVVDLLKKLLSEQRDAFVRLGQINQSITSASGGGPTSNINVNTIAGTATSVGCGTSDAGTLRVAHATDCTIPISAAALPLPAGASTAALQTQPGVDIGDVTVNNGAGAAAVNIQDGGNSITVDGTVAIGSSITPGTAATNLGKAEDSAHASGDVGVFSLSVANVAQTALAADGDYIARAADLAGNTMSVGNIAHDGVDAGNPVKVGAIAIAHGTNPTAVAAADRTNLYANRAGIPFVLGGHPNIITLEAAYTAAQTDVAIVTVGAGAKIVVTAIAALCDNANTVDVGFRIGFAAATTPTTTGVVLTHPGVSPGSGYNRGDGSGILGVGADGEDLRITSEVPTTGSIRILVSYFTIES